MTRSLQQLLGGIAAAALLLLGNGGAGAAEVSALPGGATTIADQGQGQGQPDGPIEILIVQGYVKSIDQENLTLTAPGAPADLPLRLAPDTRFIQNENDISRDQLHEGALVRAALVPMGEEFLAVVVELVPDDEQPGQQQAPGEQQAPNEQQAPPSGSGESSAPPSSL